MESRPTTICPFCKEAVLEGAVKCKHCGSALKPQALAFKTEGKLTFVGWLGCTIGALLLALGLFATPPSSEAKSVVIGSGLVFLLISYLFCRR